MEPFSGNCADKTGMPIEYEKIIKRDTYVTGVAFFDNPAAAGGRFRIEVNGSLESIESYSAEARILRLSMEPINEEVFSELLQAWEEEHIKRQGNWHGWIDEVCGDLHRSIDENGDSALFERLADIGVEVAEKLHAINRNSDLELDLTRDRLITIEPIEFSSEGLSRLSFVIDPTVSQGESDYYAPAAGVNAQSKSASLSTRGGDPDLYLYRGGMLRDKSVLPTGSNEYVFDQGGVGAWQVRVYGYTAASYTLSTDWILS